MRFTLDLRAAGHLLWMNLGAAQSKCEHVANAMLPPEDAKELYYLYLAKGIRATTAIEGNTLSEEQVRERIIKKRRLPKSQEYQGKEIDNIVAATNLIAEQILEGGECALAVDSIKQFNRMVLDGLPLEKGVVPGEVSRHQVVVANYRGAPREDCAYLLDRMCGWLNEELTAPTGGERIAYGVLRAVMAHLYIAWIHPFGDGNGRTARLVEVQILLGAGVPAVAAHLLSNHYNATREEYYRLLSEASESGGDVLSFVRYAVQGFVDHLDTQVRRIRRHQWSVAWRDYVYLRFTGMKTASAHRQRLVALELGNRKSSTPPSAIRVLTPQIAAEYARKTPKTVTRDVNALQEMGLVRRVGRSVRANRQVLQTFLPPRRDESLRR